MLISAIVATDRNHAIGHNGKIPWHLPADLRYFKEVTQGHHILMGRKTHDSIGMPLKNRIGLVLTRQHDFSSDWAEKVRSMEEAIQIAKEAGETELFIIGGGEIYLQTLAYWDRIYWTKINTVVPKADTTFPPIIPWQWQIVSEDPHFRDEKNLYDYTFKIYQKIKSLTP